MRTKVVILTLGILGSLFLPTLSASALPTITPGLTVSPAIKQITLAKDQTSVNFNALITNNTKDRMSIEIYDTDFTAYNENNGIVFLPNLNNRPHGLAQWLQADINKTALDPGQSQTIPVTITPDKNLAPGGHYGALVYKVISTGSAQKGNLIASNEGVSTLVFLTTQTGSTQNVSLGAAPIQKVTFTIPQSVNVVLNDTGNTQTAPTGWVSIVNGSNKEVARGVINPEAGLILPGTSRLYSVELKAKANQSLPGAYRMVVYYQAAGSNSTSVYTARFIVISSKTIVAIAIVIILLLVYIFRKYIPSRRKISKKPQQKPKAEIKKETKKINVLYKKD
ncbi:MAG: hypothetical protein ACHQT9_04715 [Candidatus Saccharimonadales bacterium]